MTGASIETTVVCIVASGREETDAFAVCIGADGNERGPVYRREGAA
jgi:hypothetical protein